MQCQALDKSRNYAIVIIFMHFLNNTSDFAKHSLYLYGLFYTETQSYYRYFTSAGAGK